MKLIDVKTIISVFQVSDIEKSLSWYKKWLGEPDVVPMEGVAEYELNRMFGYSCRMKGLKKLKKVLSLLG